MKLAEWHVKGKYPRMIARFPRELAWAFLAEDGAKIHFGHYEMQPLVPLSVFFGRELDLINRRDRGALVWSEKHLHQLALPNYGVLEYSGVGDEEDGEGYDGVEGG